MLFRSKASCASHVFATLAGRKIRKLASLGQPDFLSPCSLLRRLTAAGELVGDHGGIRGGRVEAVDQDAGRLAQQGRHPHLVVVPARIEDPAHVVLEHHGDRPLLGACIALRVGHQQDVPARPGLLLGAVDDLPGEGRGGDGVGDQEGKCSMNF